MRETREDGGASFEHTKDSRSMLLYCESCAVDGDGLLVGARLNKEDLAEAARMQAAGFLTFGRIPACVLKASLNAQTHWVSLTDEGWAQAHRLRRERAARAPSTPYAESVFAAVEERHGVSLSRSKSE